MMAILLALSLAITLGLSFEVCRLRKISGKNREVTREQIEAQLAKNPLVWKEERGGETAQLQNLTRWLGVKYSIIWGELSVKMHSNGDCITGYITAGYCDITLKAKAEEHRLDLVCRMLGITD